MRNCESIIFIIEKGTHDVLSIPWPPQKIKFRSGGQNFAEYDIMDLGNRLSIFKVCVQCGKLIKRYLRF